MQRAITAIYRSRAVADLVREDLERLGIGRHQVTILPEADVTSRSDRTSDDVNDAVDRLHDLYLPDEDARTYQQAIRNGDYVVSVSVDEDADLARIQEIMRRPEDAYDLDELDTRYSGAEFTPRREASVGLGDAAMGSTAASGQELNADGTVKVVEEQLHVGKRDVERGAVRVRSYVREQPVEADVELRSTRVFVERRPVNQALGVGDAAFQERTLEAREHAEQAVVAKEARVVEEIGLRQETQVEHQTIQDTVRKTEVEIEDERTGESQRLTGDDATGLGGTGTGGTTGGSGSGRI